MEVFNLIRILTVVASVLVLLLIIVGLAVPGGWIIFDFSMNTNDNEQSSTQQTWQDNTKTTTADPFDTGNSFMSNSVTNLNFHMSASIGVWKSRACVKMMGIEQCQTVTLDQMVKSMFQPTGGSTVTSDAFSGYFNFDVIRALMPLSLVFTLPGILFLVLFLRTNVGYGPSKPTIGLLSAGCWGLAALMLFMALAAAGQQNSLLKANVDTMKRVQSSVPIGMDMNILFPWALLIEGLAGCLCMVLHAVMGIWAVRLSKSGSETGDWHEFSNQTA